MKVTLKRDGFFAALSHAKKIVDKKSSIPILKHLLLKAEKNTVIITSTDMEHSLIETIPAVVEEEGKTALVAHILSDIVKNIPNNSELSLTVEEGSHRALLTSGRSKFEVPCLSWADFPKMTDKELPHNFSIHSEGLKNLLKHTSFAASTEETRYHLQGVYFHVEGGEETDLASSQEDAPPQEIEGDPVSPTPELSLCAAATDGHRLACYRVPTPEGAENIPSFIISAKTAEVLTKLFESKKELLKVSLSDSQISCELGTIKLTARLVDAEFPDYRSVIPKDNSIVIDIETHILSQTLGRVAAICDSKASGVRLKVSNKELLVTMIDKEYGSADDVLDIDYTGETIETALNHSYLKDIADKILGRALIKIGDSSSAIIIEDRHDKSALYVLMPMRL